MTPQLRFIKFLGSFLLVMLALIDCLAQKTATCELVDKIITTTRDLHYESRSIDDKYATLVFDEFLESLDPGGKYFTKQELQKLQDSKTAIDDQITEGRCEFLEFTTALFSQKLAQVNTQLEFLKKHVFDVHKEELLIYQKDDLFADKDGFSDKWRRIVKYKILNSYISNTDSLLLAQPPKATVLKKIQQEVIEREICKLEAIKSAEGGVPQFVGNKFLKAIAFGFDPHTVYLSPDEKNEFEGDLSKEAFAFGFEMSRNDRGEMEIFQIVPGSPAWNSNSMNEGDVVLSAKNSNGKIKLFDCLSSAELDEFMRSKETNFAAFNIRKKNGKETTVKLHKEKIEVTENIIRSYLLEGEQKIGYIYLPSFYTQMDSYDWLANGCGNDVAKELIQLKRAGIEGLIFDVRNNGGGSMFEAIRLAGLFIDYGAICIADSKGEDAESLKDMSRGIAYDGPLVVLQNPFSASASELFAAAMQDYNRAVIVGAPSYGKSTAQNIVAVDGTNSFYSEDGYLKVTSGMFYRVDGKSHQREGIAPDIKLPGLYDQLEYRESDVSSALMQRTIDKETYFEPMDPLPIAHLKSLSDARLADDLAFENLKDISKTIAEWQNKLVIPLAYEKFRSYYFSTPFSEEYRTSFEVAHTLFKAEIPEHSKDQLLDTETKQELNKKALEKINKDPQVRASFQIINDLINFNKK